MDKQEIRLEIIRLKKLLKPLEMHGYSEIICHNFLRTSAYKKAKTIFAYMPFNQEIRLQSIIKQAWLDNKRVALPKVTNKIMDFYYIESWNDLAIGHYNILEPTTHRIAHIDEETVVIIPGLAFDFKKNRIGYGAGYYDKYLVDKKPLAKIALAYDFQILKSIPTDPTDIKMDSIISEKRIIV